LQFVPWSRLVRNHRPGGGIEVEIVICVCRRAVGSRNIQGQDENPALTGIVQKRRRFHVRSRLLHRFGRRRQPDDRGAVRQRQELLGPDDCLDFVQPIFIERNNRVTCNLLLFQLCDDGTIVARCIAVFPGNLRRQRRHFRLILGEGSVCHPGDIRRRDVNAIGFKR
jgi:hypothetical protein